MGKYQIFRTGESTVASRLHHEQALRRWQKRFAVNRSEVAKLYDECLCRMWESYLASPKWHFVMAERPCFSCNGRSGRTPRPPHAIT